jgi:hypothetical protein
VTAGIWERLALEVVPETATTVVTPVVAAAEPVVVPTQKVQRPFLEKRTLAARRVVVYAAGDPVQIARQQDACAVHAAEAGLTIVGLAVDAEIGLSATNGSVSSGWVSAMAMLAAGDVDGILVDDRVVIPGLILAAVPPAQRRTVPLRRSPGGAR